jgi:prepilin-type processing-associated H-X9-DG protein
MGSFTDGTSNTIVFSESAVGDRGANRVKGNIGLYSTPGNNAPTPDLCRGISSDKKGYDSGKYQRGYARGEAWFVGIPAINGFVTVLPPNSPTCTNFQDDGSNYEMLTGILSASGYHTGGVNVGLGDGSVTFVSETIGAASGTVAQQNDFSSGNHSPSGNSPFGTWGALGSINGNESVSPP